MFMYFLTDTKTTLSLPASPRHLLKNYKVELVDFDPCKQTILLLGGLSHWIQLANKSSLNCQYLLVDKSSVRYKMDSYHKGAEQGPSFERFKTNIENLDLAKEQSLNGIQRSMVCMGKHLCGAATDLMLRCMTGKAGGCMESFKENDFYMLSILC